jgi:hypothetical protein
VILITCYFIHYCTDELFHNTRSRVLSSTSLLYFTHDFVTYLDDIVIVSRPRLRPLPSPPVSPTATFNPFSDFSRETSPTPLSPADWPIIPLSFPVSQSSLSSSSPGPTRHRNVHKVDGSPSTGYLSDPIFVRILPPNSSFVSFTSWFLCEHEGFRHTQTYLTTTDVCTGVTTSSPVDELTFYVTEEQATQFLAILQANTQPQPEEPCA